MRWHLTALYNLWWYCDQNVTRWNPTSAEGKFSFTCWSLFPLQHFAKKTRTLIDKFANNLLNTSKLKTEEKLHLKTHLSADFFKRLRPWWSCEGSVMKSLGQKNLLFITLTIRKLLRKVWTNQPLWSDGIILFFGSELRVVNSNGKNGDTESRTLLFDCGELSICGAKSGTLRLREKQWKLGGHEASSEHPVPEPGHVPREESQEHDTGITPVVLVGEKTAESYAWFQPQAAFWIRNGEWVFKLFQTNTFWCHREKNECYLAARIQNPTQINGQILHVVSVWVLRVQAKGAQARVCPVWKGPI